MRQTLVCLLEFCIVVYLSFLQIYFLFSKFACPAVHLLKAKLSFRIQPSSPALGEPSLFPPHPPELALSGGLFRTLLKPETGIILVLEGRASAGVSGQASLVASFTGQEAKHSRDSRAGAEGRCLIHKALCQQASCHKH